MVHFNWTFCGWGLPDNLIMNTDVIIGTLHKEGSERVHVIHQTSTKGPIRQTTLQLVLDTLTTRYVISTMPY